MSATSVSLDPYRRSASATVPATRQNMSSGCSTGVPVASLIRYRLLITVRAFSLSWASPWGGTAGIGISYNSPQDKRVVNKKTTHLGQHALASIVSMRAGILPGFVSPRQWLVISLCDNALGIPHHEWRLRPHFSTRTSVPMSRSAHAYQAPMVSARLSCAPSPKYPKALQLDRSEGAVRLLFHQWAVDPRRMVSLET